ncbi:tyrosine-type recombinase/integrase [Nocardioides daeguensis]|uniref:Tyr recombinase domain-containing protein n=1 Tax=Nocardioides daeguensis TaxID=908359 RepID=A0ABP6VEE2_9ACTN|nr:tyrosine-type recombinase/integrase [Nocardioides daeguensis]MBV6729838.1 tyrosine-type recombinase/integrase [Nocardioides daeguensis]MCR1772422.1 tyrosine-type recombinase/integrase [Nocardioides daeguensis]
MHGTEADATATRIRLLAAGRPVVPPPDRVTVDYLLQAWLAADHPWKPSTYVGYISNARALSRDPLAQRPAAALSPHEIRQRLAAWQTAGSSDAVLAARFRALRACLTWAYNERLLDTHPLRLMRGPHRASPRQALSGDEVRALLLTAEIRVLEAQANLPRSTTTAAPADPASAAARTAAAVASSAAWRRLRVAEQDLLLVRLAADSGARRGELAALRFGDLTGRVLHIQRAVSAGQLTTPKSGRGRSLALGADTAALWHRLHDDWSRRYADVGGFAREVMRDGRAAVRLGPWLFSADASHQRRLGTEALGHRFEDLRDAAGVPTATLHRLRHTVATFLVSQGKILEAQDRLGHGDASTTLREYSHALPGRHEVVADAINMFLDLAKDSSGDLGARTTSHLDPED